MIWYITGKPRSGKSYLAVYKINDFFKTDRYETIYTNIGGFNFNQFDGKVKKLDFEFFFDEYAKELYDLFKKYKKEYEDYDEKIIEKVKNDGYFESAFFVDECQTYLSHQRAHLLWLFSYQGHLGFDFYFITQALGLVHSKYKLTIENVTNAVSSSFRLSNKYFTYQLYAATSMRSSDKMSSFRLPVKQSIFKLYKSGDKITQKSLMLPRILFVLLFLVALFLSYKFFVSNAFKKPETVEDVQHTRSAIPESSSSRSMLPGQYLLRVSCAFGVCRSSKFNDLPYELFKHYREEVYEVVSFVKGKYSVDIYVLTSDEQLSIFRDFAMPVKKKKGFVNDLF